MSWFRDRLHMGRGEFWNWRAHLLSGARQLALAPAAAAKLSAFGRFHGYLIHSVNDVAGAQGYLLRLLAQSQEATRGASARRPLSVAHQPDRVGSREALGIRPAVGVCRGSVQDARR